MLEDNRLQFVNLITFELNAVDFLFHFCFFRTLLFTIFLFCNIFSFIKRNAHLLDFIPFDNRWYPIPNYRQQRTAAATKKWIQNGKTRHL